MVILQGGGGGGGGGAGDGADINVSRKDVCIVLFSLQYIILYLHYITIQHSINLNLFNVSYSKTNLE